MSQHEFTHADIVEITISGTKYKGRIEERFVDQWPRNKRALYVVVDTHMPHFAIQLDSFISNYGTIKKKEL